MNIKPDIVNKIEIEHLNETIEEKKSKISEFSHQKLLFEKERCEQILNRNIPMCISLHIKNILQSGDKKRILGQLHRLNLECYWKLLNLDYLSEIIKQLDKIK